MFLEPVNEDTDTDQLVGTACSETESLLALILFIRMRNKKMKIKWVELTEDDPIFRQGFEYQIRV